MREKKMAKEKKKSTENTEIKRKLRDLFPSFKLSVRTSWFGYSKATYILITNFNDIITNEEDYNKIVPQFVKACQELVEEKVFYDEKTQEYLLGGNTYLNVGYRNDDLITLFPAY
ncbi:MAG: hypothetical protein ACKO96_48355 [Flammeovirgaceae bacterium]